MLTLRAPVCARAALPPQRRPAERTAADRASRRAALVVLGSFWLSAKAATAAAVDAGCAKKCYNECITLAPVSAVAGCAFCACVRLRGSTPHSPACRVSLQTLQRQGSKDYWCGRMRRQEARQAGQIARRCARNCARTH
jgi:hypothetical protein